MNTVISQDGTTIAYAKLGHGPAVILVAGAFCSRTRRSGPELAKLLASRFTVYNYDRRAAARGAIPSPMPSRVRSRISKHSSTKLAGRPTCMAFPLELPLPCTRPYSSARKSRSWLCTSRLYIVGAIRLSGTMHCVHSIRECMNSREENALVGKAAIRACCQRQPQLRKKRDFLPIMFPREYRQHSPLHSEQGKRKKTCQDPIGDLGMIAEPTGTDGLRLRCRQFYTSSNYPQVPSIASSKSSCHRKIKFLLSLRHSAGLGRKTFPTASLLRSGRLCLRESKTMNPTAK
jgi:hypothetical protein